MEQVEEEEEEEMKVDYQLIESRQQTSRVIVRASKTLSY